MLRIRGKKGAHGQHLSRVQSELPTQLIALQHSGCPSRKCYVTKIASGTCLALVAAEQVGTLCKNKGQGIVQ